ncbi:hypothetical protein [Bartonella gliris]|uniref:hypothetical protein n=1 Tax=Bartonella gliris TaxID=3004109 RepID=UPI0038736A51
MAVLSIATPFIMAEKVESKSTFFLMGIFALNVCFPDGFDYSVNDMDMAIKAFHKWKKIGCSLQVHLNAKHALLLKILIQ